MSIAVLIITWINSSGIREILAVEPVYRESEGTYTHLFNKFKGRGLQDVWFVVSDAHKVLGAAVNKCFLGASWHRRV